MFTATNNCFFRDMYNKSKTSLWTVGENQSAQSKSMQSQGEQANFTLKGLSRQCNSNPERSVLTSVPLHCPLGKVFLDLDDIL